MQTTPGLVSRSASHPVPTRSAPGTPVFTRRGLTPGKSTPGRRPVSQTDFRDFGPNDLILEYSDDEF